MLGTRQIVQIGYVMYLVGFSSENKNVERSKQHGWKDTADFFLWYPLPPPLPPPALLVNHRLRLSELSVMVHSKFYNSPPTLQVFVVRAWLDYNYS